MSLQQASPPVNGTSDPVQPSTQQPATPHGQLHAQTKPADSASKMAKDTKMPNDIMAYEDEWVGWDGPVWCSRFGRFENQEDAAHDDGYTEVPGFPVYENRNLHRCEKSTCRVPSQHRSYVSDIKRRIEPMSKTLVQLEHQVQDLVRHFVKDGQTFVRTGSFHDDKNGGAIPVHHGEMGSPNYQQPLAHNSETGGILEPTGTPTHRSNGTEQELSHPRHAHYKEGYNQEGPPVDSAQFNAGYNQEHPHYEHVKKQNPEPAKFNEAYNQEYPHYEHVKQEQHHPQQQQDTEPPAALNASKENYNQEWPHYEHVKQQHVEPMEHTIRKLQSQVESLSRQMKMLIDGGAEEEVKRGKKDDIQRP